MIVVVGESFNLEKAVCNHGFFMMAPNHWIPAEKCLRRPLHLSNGASLTVSITQPPDKSFLLIHHNKPSISSQDKQAIQDQVTRMLRISAEDERMVKEFHRVNPEARNAGFARIFRSPTLFEDIVKCILLCNMKWSGSLRMAEALCNLSSCGEKRLKRKRSKDDDDKVLNFPSPKEIACVRDKETLNKHCNLGYRASTILRVARDIVEGRLNLGDLQPPNSSYNSIRQQLTKIKGVGSFTRANILMCLGSFEEIPADTETIRHLQEVHGKTETNKKNKAKILKEVYGKHAPFQCLAYWMKHVEYYEKRLGKLSLLQPSEYYNVSTSQLHNFDASNEIS